MDSGKDSGNVTAASTGSAENVAKPRPTYALGTTMSLCRWEPPTQNH
jgi:hypothetical protein